MLIRLELSGPVAEYIGDNELYNSIITVHAIIMIFFMVIPAMIGGFGNFLLASLIGQFDADSLKSFLYKLLYAIILIASILIFLIFIFSYFSSPLLCDSFGWSMENGHIGRTVIPLKKGQTIADLTAGLYPVTGGNVMLGYVGKGDVVRVIGVMVEGCPTRVEDWVYTFGNQPFNTNFAKVLYELREANQQYISYKLLDYHYSRKEEGLYASYFRQFKTFNGISEDASRPGSTLLTSTLLNQLAEQTG